MDYLILLSQIVADVDEVAQALDVVRVLHMDRLSKKKKKSSGSLHTDRLYTNTDALVIIYRSKLKINK